MQKNDNYKWEVLVLLWLAYFLNQADRQVFNVVMPLVKAELKLTDVQIGTIATIFNLVYALFVPVAGYIGDIYSRKWVITLSVLFWSTATMFTGLGSTVFSLIMLRSVATGGGEAFFGPANYTLLASYHKNTRSLAMSIHQTSYYLGIILSGLIAGYVGEHYGWRNAFYIFGAVGVVHSLVLFYRLKDNDVHDELKQNSRVKYTDALRVLLNTPSAIVLTISFSGLIFVLVGYLTWTPTYLYEKFNMSITQAGFQSMFYTHLFAFLGVILAGKLSDNWAKKNPSIRMLMMGIGLLIAVPFIVLMGNANSLILVYLGFAGFGFGRAFFDGNTYTVLYEIIPEKFQSSVSGIMLMIGFSVGSLSPIILGYLKPILGLSMGISLLSCVWIFCGILLIITAKYQFIKDKNKVLEF
jgi:MFS family permease